MNEKELEIVKEKALEDHIPIIMDDTLEKIKEILENEKPNRILEIGTAVGYSASQFARYTDKKCKIDTIEIDEERAKEAKKFVYARIDKEKADYVLKVARLARDSFRNFLTGQAKEAVILGSLCAIGMLILGIPYAGPIGALTAITAFIPIVGAFIGGFIGAILIVAVDPIKALIFIIFIIVLQQVEGNLIYPHVVGKNMGLPSIWVLVAITIGGSLFGIMGMIIGLPVVSIIYAITQESTNKKLKEKHLEDEF